MSTTYPIACRRRRAARFFNLVIAIPAYLARMNEHRRAASALHLLSDHQLRDIGISRAEIDHAIIHGRPRD